MAIRALEMTWVVFGKGQFSRVLCQSRIYSVKLSDNNANDSARLIYKLSLSTTFTDSVIKSENSQIVLTVAGT